MGAQQILMVDPDHVNSPALVTTDPPDTDRDDAGVIGQRGAEVLLAMSD